MKKGVLVTVVFFVVLLLIAGIYTIYFGSDEPRLQPAGNVIYVEPDLEVYGGPCDTYNPVDQTCFEGGSNLVFDTIQGAIDNSSSGDTISIRGGQYLGLASISVGGEAGLPLTISVYPGEDVVIDANGEEFCFIIEGVSDVVIDGIECTNVVSQTSQSAGIYANLVQRLRISNVKINNSPRGVLVEDGSSQDITIENSYFDSLSEGAAISITARDTLTIRNNLITPYTSGSTTSEMDCINVNGGADVAIEGNILHHCSDSGIELHDISNVLVKDNIVYEIKSGYGISSMMASGNFVSNAFEYNAVFNTNSEGFIFNGAGNSINVYHNLAYGTQNAFGFVQGEPSEYFNNIGGGNADSSFGNMGEDPLFLDTSHLTKDDDSNGNPNVFQTCEETNLPNLDNVRSCFDEWMRAIFGVSQGSKAIDNGVIITGINNALCVGEDQYCYIGDNPDIGLYETNYATPGCSVDADCDNGLWCDGTETCDLNLNGGTCVAGSASCTAQQTCDEANDICNDVSCVTDSDCDNGLYCDGVEFCNENNECEFGTPVICEDGLFCNGISTCDEDIDSCVTADPNPCGDDGISCQACDEIYDQCDVPQNALCVETGNVCDPTNQGIDGVGCYVDVTVFCGDDNIVAGEQCDASNLNSETCASLGYPAGGNLVCDSGCQFDVSSCSRLPKYYSFVGTQTTNFDSEANINSVSDAIIQNSFGVIDFYGRTANFERLDLDSYVTIEQGRIGIDVNAPLMFRINIPATISFYNIDIANPVIQKDGIDCSFCEIKSYTSDGNLTVEVANFSVYTVVDGGSGNTNPPPPGGNTNGGGGNTGGGPITNPVNNTPGPNCVPQWKCSDYSECNADGIQTRVCTDIHLCGNDLTKPREISECGEYQDLGFDQNNEGNQSLFGEKLTSLFNSKVFFITLILAFALIAIVVSSAILIMRKRAESRMKRDLINRVVVQNGWEGLR